MTARQDLPTVIIMRKNAESRARCNNLEKWSAVEEHKSIDVFRLTKSFLDEKQ